MGYANAIAAEGDLTGALDLLRRLAETSPTPDLASRTGDLLRLAAATLSGYACVAGAAPLRANSSIACAKVSTSSSVV